MPQDSFGAVQVHDARFHRLILGSARMERLASGCRWSEGPAYFPAGRYLIWSDIPNDRLLRYDETDGSVSVFWQGCGNHNGHTVDAQGRLISCEHLARVVSRTEHDGSRTVLASHVDGKRLNSPNDVVVKSDGSIWFTDPSYGIDSDYEGVRADSEIGACHVYRIDPATGAVEAMITDRARPNGLAFTPDERFLMVADTGRTHVEGWPITITAYAMGEDGRPGPGKLFAEGRHGLYDGFRFDTAGNLWTSSGEGIDCHAPDGILLGRIEVGELVANLCFGGPRRNRLYICAQTSLYALYVNARGVGWV
jgi:gluconolactonase